MMNEYKWSVAIIDEGIDILKINEFFPNILVKIRLVENTYNFIDEDLFINHGTLCTALFLEKIKEYNLLEKVEITCFPITKRDGSKSIDELMKVLTYCQRKHFDFILMSIGLKNMIYAKKLSNCINKVSKSILLASESNDLKISYPASLPTVIGIKRAEKNLNDITVAESSYDGIELLVPYYKTSILTFLKSQYNLDYSMSNSILVPYVAAKIINIVNNLKLKTVTKKDILSFFMKKINNKEMINRKNEEKAIVVIDYTECNYIILKENLIRLQNIFVENMYNCYVLTDNIEYSNFEIQWLKLFSPNINEDICNYCNVIYNGLVILFVNHYLSQKINCEHLKYNLSDKMNKIGNMIDIMNDILKKLS